MRKNPSVVSLNRVLLKWNPVLSLYFFQTYQEEKVSPGGVSACRLSKKKMQQRGNEIDKLN